MGVNRYQVTYETPLSPGRNDVLPHIGAQPFYFNFLSVTDEYTASSAPQAKETAPELLVSTSGLGHGRYPDELAGAADFILIHFNGTTLEDSPARIAALKRFGKPIVCNEDPKTGAAVCK